MAAIFSESYSAYALIVVATLLSFCNALGTPFVFPDDLMSILSSGKVYEAGLQAVLAGITPDRPLEAITLWLNYQMSGLAPFGYRITNVFLHAATGCAVYSLFLRLSSAFATRQAKLLALGCALLYTLHPVHNQAVNLILQRGVILSGLFFTLSFLYFLKGLESRRRQDLLLCFLCYLLALLSKATAVAFPAVAILYTLFFVPEKGARAVAWPTIAVCILLSGIVVVAYLVLGLNPQHGLSMPDYLLAQTRVLFLYVRLFFVPIRLRYLYDISGDPRLSLNLTWLAVIGHLVALGASGYALLRHRSLLAFCVLAAYLAFAPESSIFPIDHLAWEYRTYIPFIFFCLGALVIGQNIMQRGGRVLPVIFLLAPVLMALNLARTSEIDTLRKWVFNTFRYAKSFHPFNYRILSELALLGEYLDGAALSADLAPRFPQMPEYSLYHEAMLYMQLSAPRDERKLSHLLEALQATQGPALASPVRTSLDLLVLSELQNRWTGTALDERAERLLFPQLSRYGAGAFTSRQLYDLYFGVVTRLRDRLGKAGVRLSLAQQLQYLRSRCALEIFFDQPQPGLKVELLELSKKHPAFTDAAQLVEWHQGVIRAMRPSEQ